MKHCKICGSINPDNATTCASCKSDFAPSTVPGNHQCSRGGINTSLVKRFAILIGILVFIVFFSMFDFRDAVRILLICFWIVGWLFLTYYVTRKMGLLKKLGIGRAAQEAEAQEAEATMAEEQADALMPQSDVAPVPAMAEVTPDATVRGTTSAEARTSDEPYIAVDYSTPIAFDSQMTPESAMLHFSTKLGGLDVQAARTLLAALAARRMILLCGSNGTDIERALDAVSSLTGEKIIEFPKNQSGEDGEKAVTQSLSGVLCDAYKHGRSIYPILLTDDVTDTPLFSSDALRAYLENGMVEGMLVPDGIKTPVPATTRLFLAYQPAQSVFPEGVKGYSFALVTLKSAIALGGEESLPTGALSFDRLARLCKDAEEEYYLTEENWQKIDTLVEQLSGVYTFTLGNRVVMAMERFVGVYMATGATENEALDAVLSSILLPAVLTSPICSTAEESVDISERLDTIFGLENLPTCSEMLKTCGLV